MGGGGDVKCFSGLCSCIPSSKQSGALDPITHAPGSRPPASGATPLSLPAPDSHREHDLHQGNSVNGLAHWHHPWASEYTPTLLPPTANLFFLQCLSVCLSAGVPAPEGRTQTAGLKVPLTHLQSRKEPWSLWLLISVSKIQRPRSPVLRTPSPPSTPHS